MGGIYSSSEESRWRSTQGWELLRAERQEDGGGNTGSERCWIIVGVVGYVYPRVKNESAHSCWKVVSATPGEEKKTREEKAMKDLSAGWEV